ncbi:hypothetical protein BT93_L1531 [Corymbia citriodora subsp. variegata]|uniref:DUF4220 domain-containing protein n=1 Tax=Corymbia citriodora subsp. variegata TaxID=360336 RepID=A0A8T0CMD0_CORYI|nr:hypothetical protein BT93_L1531 [Corymbia citriodora subsp. variegata]
MTCLWKNWSIQIFVLLGLIFQFVLAVFGSRRKISSANTIKFVIWASYSLAPYILTLALSKLSNVSLNKSDEEYYTELKALLAALTLLLLGGPDSITAYSAEDNRVGVRSVMNSAIAFSFVIWILGRCWKTSTRMTLFFPMFVAGIVKCGETSWALYSVYDEIANMEQADFNFDEEEDISVALMNFPRNVPRLEIFLKAYYRFDCLKPHLGDRLKFSFFMKRCNKLIEECAPEEVFQIIDMELGFMYDVLYTKAPVLYTKLGITLRGISYFSLLGEWSLGIASLDKLNWSIKMAFDKSIIIWHIATHVCYHLCDEKSSRKDASKLMSDYMMFLLLRHPSMLSLTTTDITFSHAYMRFKKFLSEKQHNKENVLKALSGPEPVQEGESERSLGIVITKGWNVLEEARKLATDLEDTTDKWEVITSVWVEMLCFAAYNCQQYHHLKLLRHGGDIITHVWLLLSHNTDKFNTAFGT